MKNLLVFLLIALVAGLGVSYAVYNDPELPSVRLFEQTIEEFAKQAASLEAEFRAENTLKPSKDSLILDYVTEDITSDTQNLVVEMIIESHHITLIFADGDWPFANQSIVLETFIKEGVVRWKCIAGSVLIRYRAKDCRLAYRLLFNH